MPTNHTKQNSIKIHSDLVYPSKIVCVGRNYVAHINELNNDMPDEPVIFMKPNSAIGESLKRHKKDEIHFEAELCFSIQNNQLFAVGLGLDLTKRSVQTKLKEKGLPWEKAKAFDGSAVFSDFMPLDDARFAKCELDSLSFTLHIDGVLAQAGDYALMLYKPKDLVEHISESFSLLDGDIVMTGTPSGVGKVEAGSIYKVALFAQDKQTPILSAQWRAN